MRYATDDIPLTHDNWKNSTKTRAGRRQEHDKQIILHNKVIFIDANDSSFVLQF